MNTDVSELLDRIEQLSHEECRDWLIKLVLTATAGPPLRKDDSIWE